MWTPLSADTAGLTAGRIGLWPRVRADPRRASRTRRAGLRLVETRSQSTRSLRHAAAATRFGLGPSVTPTRQSTRRRCSATHGPTACVSHSRESRPRVCATSSQEGVRRARCGAHRTRPSSRRLGRLMAWATIESTRCEINSRRPTRSPRLPRSTRNTEPMPVTRRRLRTTPELTPITRITPGTSLRRA
jgi:hypothetical protein